MKAIHPQGLGLYVLRRLAGRKLRAEGGLSARMERLRSIKEVDKCLSCLLSDCNETSPECLLFKGEKNKAQKSYYQRKKHDPDFRRKRAEEKKAWRRTPAGRESMRKTAARWRKKNPDLAREIWRKSHKRNKEKRLARHRDYMRERRKVDGKTSRTT